MRPNNFVHKALDWLRMRVGRWRRRSQGAGAQSEVGRQLPVQVEQKWRWPAVMALGASAAPVYVIYPQSKNKSVKKLELIFCLSLLFTSVTRSGSSVLICYCSDSSSFFVVYAFTNSINGSGGINLCFRVFRTLCVRVCICPGRDIFQPACYRIIVSLVAFQHYYDFQNFCIISWYDTGQSFLSMCCVLCVPKVWSMYTEVNAWCID